MEMFCIFAGVFRCCGIITTLSVEEFVRTMKEKKKQYSAPKARIFVIPHGSSLLASFSLEGNISDLEKGEIEDGDDDDWGAFVPSN